MSKTLKFSLALICVVCLFVSSMGGFAAAAAIRRMDRRDAGRVPIFALSAAAPQYCRKEAEESGVDVCLQKPVQMGELARLMNGLSGDICSGLGSDGM